VTRPPVEPGPTEAGPTEPGSSADKIRVLLADDQALVRGALASLLSLEPDLDVVSEVGRGDEVVPAARSTRPDVALLDVEMPGLDGIAATAALRAALPGCRVLVVTTFGRPGYLRRALEAGASGFVVKDTPARRLADAVRRVHAGLRVVDPVLAAESLAAGDSPLTDRETDVLRVARTGGTVADLAAALHLSEGTVRNHLSAAIGKTGARTRAEAVRLAEEAGWLLG
jgi:two-component system response regulator DesR